ncbi:MAG: helix-turn-helix domain-containing protein [Pseudomonadota bacterium]
MTDNNTKRKLVEAALSSAETTVSLLRAQLAEIDSAPANDPQLGCDDLLREFKLGRGTVQSAVERGELTASRGARGKILVARSEVERWLRSRPYKPGPRRVEETDDTDALEDALRSGDLVRGAK